MVRKLRDAGLQAGAICAPVLPGITDAAADLEVLVRAAGRAGAQWFYTNPLFLKPCSEKIFMPFLEREFPELAEGYRQRYASRAFVSAAYRKRISEIVHRLCDKYGIGRRRFGRSANPSREIPLETQLPLFRLLGTPEGQKRHVQFDSGHMPPIQDVMREILDWLERNLGPVEIRQGAIIRGSAAILAVRHRASAATFAGPARRVSIADNSAV